MAEFTAKTIQELAPNVPNPGGNTNKRLVYIKGAAAANADIFTVSDLTTVDGAYLIITATGALATLTFATNVITLAAGGAATYTGLAWGQ